MHETDTAINVERRQPVILAMQARVSIMLRNTEEGSRLGLFHL